MQAKPSLPVADTVESISDNRNPKPVDRGGVQAELVGPSGDRPELDARLAIFDGQLLPVRDPDLSVDRIVDLTGTVFYVEPKGQFDRAFVTGQFAVEQCDVALFGFPVVELARQGAMGLCRERQDHQAGGVHVQSVHGRLLDAARTERPDAGHDTILPVCAPARHGQQSGRFHHDHQVFVTVDDGKDILIFHGMQPPAQPT